MATDDSILEEELKNLSAQLKQDLHMRNIHALARTQVAHSKISIQNKQISYLEMQVAELETTVSKFYSTQHNLRDHEIKGYLIYLLQMKEFFTNEVKTKMEIIHKREEQVKSLVVKLCNMRNEYVKKKKLKPSRSADFNKLENMSNRMCQIEKRVCGLQTKNKEFRQKILDLMGFERKYKKIEKELRSKVEEMEHIIQRHLNVAVNTYEEREQFVNKAKIHRDRCAQDVRKFTLNENNLNLILEKTEKFEKFEELQKEERADIRISITGDLIRSGVTKLEPILKKENDLYLDIAQASGQESPSQMKKYYYLNEDMTDSLFTYLEGLLEEVNHTQNIISNLKEQNRNFLNRMSEKKKKMSWEISKNQSIVGLQKLEADRAEYHLAEGRAELDTLLNGLWKVYLKCYPTDSDFKEGIDDTSSIMVREKVEKLIIEYLMLIEYLKMKEDLAKKESSVIKAKDDSPSIAEFQEIKKLDAVHLRRFESEPPLSSLTSLQQTKRFLSLEHLKTVALKAVSELESEQSKSEDEA